MLTLERCCAERGTGIVPATTAAIAYESPLSPSSPLIPHSVFLLSDPLHTRLVTSPASQQRIRRSARRIMMPVAVTGTRDDNFRRLSSSRVTLPCNGETPWTRWLIKTARHAYTHSRVLKFLRSRKYFPSKASSARQPAALLPGCTGCRARKTTQGGGEAKGGCSGPPAER